MNKTNTTPVRTGRTHSTCPLLAIAALLLLLMAGAASAETTYGDGWRQVCYDDGRCVKTIGVTTYKLYNGSYVPTLISQTNPVPLGYDILWNGGRLHTRWDGTYAFDMIVNPDTDQTVSYWDFWHVESYKTTGQGSWQEEIPVSNTFVKIDNSTLKRMMTLDSGGKFNITYHVQGNKLKADLELTAGYNRQYRFVHRTDTIPSNFSLNNQSKKFDANFFNGLLIYDWSDVQPYTTDENGTYVGGYNTTQWVDQSAHKFYQQIEGVKRLNVSEKWVVDPSWQVGGSGGNAWSGNSSFDNTTAKDVTVKIGVSDDGFESGNVNQWTQSEQKIYLNSTTYSSGIYSGQINSTNEGWWLLYSFANQTSTFTFAYDFYISGGWGTNAQREIVIGNVADRSGVSLHVYNDGTGVALWKRSGSYAKVMNLNKSQWYFLRAVIYPSTSTYDLYIDEVSKLTGQATQGTVNAYTNISFNSYSMATTDILNLDNVRIWKSTFGNLTTWHDAGSNNETYQVDVNATGNYSVSYNNNDSGMPNVELGNFTAASFDTWNNQSITIAPNTKYQDTIINATLFGNTTATSTLYTITFFTQAASGGGSSGAIPPNPTNSANTTGNFWANHTWAAGAGNITNSYNVSQNGTWTNGSAINFSNASVGAHGWSNITVFAFNSSGNGNLSTGSVSQNTQIPNNAISISNISDNYSITEGQTLSIDANYADADSDTGTFADNATQWNVNTTTGIVSWVTVDGDQGTYNWLINVSDGYGSVATKTFTVTVSDSTPGTISGLANTTGNFWINWTWNAGSNADDYDVQINSTDIGYDNDTRYYNGTYSAHATRIISVRTHNHTLNSYSAWTNQTTTISNNVPVQAAIGSKNVDENQWLNFTVSVSDADGDSLTNATNATKGSFTAATGAFSWKPSYTESGTYYWYFNSSDGYGGTANDTITVTVTNIPLSVTSSSPASDPTTTQGTAQIFSVTLNRTANVTWYMNGSLMQTNSSVTTATYTNSTAPANASWNVTASITDGIDSTSRRWNWTVQAAGASAINLNIFGDSISSADVYNGVAYVDKYPSLIEMGTNYTLNNQATTGAQITDAGIIDNVYTQTITDDVSVGLFGYNDYRYFGSNQTALNAYNNTLLSAALWLLTPETNKTRAQNVTAVQYVGAWSNASTYGGAVGKITNAAGATASFNLTGTYIIIGSTKVKGTTQGFFNITVDGTYYGNYSVYDNYTAASGRVFYPFVVVISGLADTSHQVIISRNTTAGRYIYFDWATSDINATPASLYLGNTIRMANYSAGSYINGSDANSTLYNDVNSYVVTTISSLGITNISLVDANATYNPLTDIGADSIHPNTAGQLSLYNSFVNVMRTVSGFYLGTPANLSVNLSTSEYYSYSRGVNISTDTKVNLTLTSSDFINVTLNAYNSTVINLTAINSTAGQTMNLTAYNDTFPITNGANYQILKDGTIQQTAVASGNAVTFTSISVGSDYTIQEGGGSYTPPTPVSCSAFTGNFWINTSCSAGTGNITNGMNFTNGTVWVNGTSFFANRILSPHAWSNESIYGFNSSGTGTLNQTPATLNTQIPNNVPVMNAIGNKNADENTWLNFTVSGSDADSDSLTCSTNASKGTLTGCNFNWSITYDDAGTYLWTYYLNDSYSGSDSETITVTVSNIVNGTANITAWSNSNTSNSSLTFTVAKNTNITFNITANQSVTTTWTGTASPTKINGTGATDSYAFKNFTSTGTFTVIASCSNDNGSCTNGKTWTITVTGIGGITVEGYIKNALELNLENVRVDFNGSYVFTNSNGYYSIGNISEGTYTTLARMVGYRNNSNTTSISGNTILNFTMRERTLGTVSAPGFNITGAVFILAILWYVRRSRR